MGRIVNLLAAQGIHLAQEHKRQVLSLDREFEDMEAKIKVLESEKLRLEAEVNPLQRDVEKLKNQIQSLKNPAAAKGNDSLDEEAEKLLFAIANGVHVPVGGGASIVGGTAAQAKYFLGLLERRGFINPPPRSYTGSSRRYTATHDGLAYLHKIGRL